MAQDFIILMIVAALARQSQVFQFGFAAFFNRDDVFNGERLHGKAQLA